MILDFDPNLIAMLDQFNLYLFALAVPASISEGFLGDTVDGIFQDRRQPLELDLC